MVLSILKRIWRNFGWARIIGFGLLVVLLLLRIADPSFIQILRNQSFDTFQRIQPREQTAQPIVIIDVDERSLEAIGQWPWPRTKLAKMINNTAASGAVAIAFDMVFAEKDRLSPDQIAKDNPQLSEDISNALAGLPQNDAVFSKTMKQFRVVVGQTAVRSALDNRVEKRELADVQVGFRGQDPKPYLLKFNDIVQNRPEFEKAASGRGVFTIRQDIDGVIRRIPLVMMVQEKIRLALSTELLRIATGGRAFAITTDEAGIADIRLAGKTIKTDNQGHVWPYFSKPNRNRYISAMDVINAQEPLSELKGKLVLVGTSAIGLEDFRATPLGISMAGVEIHTQVLENILSNSMLYRPHFAIAVELVLIFTLGLLVIIFLPSIGAWLSVIGISVVLSAYVWLSWYGFSQHRLLIDPMIPTISCFMVFILIAMANYLREERMRREVHTAMGQYVSPALVDELAQNPERLTLGGETKDLSVLFSDVRGFTAISESYKDNPQGLTQLMNEFLSEMSEAILHHDGTIDKFMGDAVMAFWNAPIDCEEHALASCRAALLMIDQVGKLNQTRLTQNNNENVHQIDIGIGINTGSCVVGNMGSHSRFDYTALGDTVNLASRLEGQTKSYGVKIVLGSETARWVEDEMAILELDSIRVKGKQISEHIYALLGDQRLKSNSAFQEISKINSNMLQAYRDEKWTVAERLIKKLEAHQAKLNLGLEDYLSLYETRIKGVRTKS